MEINEVVISKQACEKRIADIVRAFMDETGCSVESIDMFLNREISGKVSLNYISMDVRLLNYIPSNKRQG